MRVDPFAHSDYKTYLRAIETEDSRGGRGFRSRLAAALRCNIAYISQILNKSAQLSLEQAEELNGHLGHAASEADYFLLLVQVERAGSVKLASRLKKQATRRTEERLLLRNRVDIKTSLSPERQIQYYSSWHYAAVHVALSVPGLSDSNSIATALGITVTRVEETLAFLEQVGLATRVAGRYEIGTSRVFLKSDSPMIWKHHTNWRTKAIVSFDRARADDLHLSTVFTVAESDVPKMKERILKCIEEVRGQIKLSKEEKVQCFNVDFFSV